jgi:hypothetical protein
VSARGMRPLLISGLIIAVLMAAYFVLRFRASTQGAPGATSESVSANRVSKPARAAQEPAPAASATATSNGAGADFHTLQICAYASHELAAANYLSDCKEYEGKPQYQSYYAQCMNGWMNVRSRKAEAEAALKDSNCGETTDLDARYFEATEQAASAGDADAQMCYLQGEFSTSSGKSLFTDPELEEYGRVASSYVDAALRRGDWRIVEFMTKDNFHPGVEPFRQIPDIGKKETVYKMRKLLRLGASGSYAELLDMELNGMIHPDLVPEAALPADVVKAGDAWAQQTFNEYFSGVAGLTERPTVCGPPLPSIGSLPTP